MLHLERMVKKKVVDPHPTNQMVSEVIDVSDDVATVDCLTGWNEVLSSSVDVIHNIIGRLPLKSTGSISNDTKRKAL